MQLLCRAMQLGFPGSLLLACALQLFFFHSANAGFWTQASTVAGVKIANFHEVQGLPGVVFRGAQPMGREHELVKLGLTEVLILKNENWREVRSEIRRWGEFGFTENRILAIPFQWHNSNEERACDQLMESLIFARKSILETRSRLFIHCTAGEDRTGLFIGILRMLTSGVRHEEAFEEMCRYGYGAANRWKPRYIVNQVQAGLTPLLLKFSYWIENRHLHWDRIDPQLCRQIKTTPPLDAPTRFRCR